MYGGYNMAGKQLTTAPAGADIIEEVFFNTNGLPQWILNLQYKNIPCKILFYILLVLLLR